MPIYAYRCQDCGHELEALQSMNEAPLSTCPECNKDALKKQVVAPAFTFKGGGWYKDLYASTSSEKKTTESKPEPKKTDSSDSSKSKPKTDSKAASA